MPSDAILASMEADNIRVEKLVHEFLSAQSLKVLPQGPFGDAVKQFVDKDDKGVLNEFVKTSLDNSVNEMIAMTAEEVDLDPIMERIRVRQETQFATGNVKRFTRGKLKPRPLTWDSDLEGEWEDHPGAFEIIEVEDDEDGIPGPAAKRGNNAAAFGEIDSSVISTAKVASKTAATKKAPEKKAPANSKAPVKVKAPAKAPTRGRKKVVEPSDDEDDDEDEDVMMLDEEPPAAKSQPKRAAATKAARQTQLNFSQSQAKTQTARELSDDEISDDDAFEPMPSSRRR